MNIRDTWFKLYSFLPYILLGLILVINLFLIVDKKFLLKFIEEEKQQNFLHRVEANHIQYEEELMMMGNFPTSLLSKEEALESSSGGFSVYFLLFYSALDCFNCLETEIPQLNKIDSMGVQKVIGYYKHYNIELIERITELLSPRFSLFPLDSISTLSDIKTPAVLVVERGDGNRILDVHQPIPNDLQKSDIFYQKWNHILKLSKID